jgi:L-threonylcarbamoyladenylate synthase
VARALLDAAAALGVPGVSGPSANRFGRISPTSAAHVHEEFGDALTIVDGGDCEAGIESAIVDCTRKVPALLRPGVLTRDAIEAVLGGRLREPGDDAPRASGTLEAHYAPRAKLRLMPARELKIALSVLPKSPVNPVAVYFRTVSPGSSVRASRAMPDNPVAAAHELFAALRELDASGASLIWVETPPDAPAWEGVRDRLQRAAAA